MKKLLFFMFLLIQFKIYNCTYKFKRKHLICSLAILTITYGTKNFLDYIFPSIFYLLTFEKNNPHVNLNKNINLKLYFKKIEIPFVSNDQTINNKYGNYCYNNTFGSITSDKNYVDMYENFKKNYIETEKANLKKSIDNIKIENLNTNEFKILKNGKGDSSSALLQQICPFGEFYVDTFGNSQIQLGKNKEIIDMSNFNEKNNNYLYLMTISSPLNFQDNNDENKKNSAFRMWENIFYGAFFEFQKINETKKLNSDKIIRQDDLKNIKIFCPALGQGIFKGITSLFLLAMIKAFNEFKKVITNEMKIELYYNPGPKEKIIEFRKFFCKRDFIDYIKQPNAKFDENKLLKESEIKEYEFNNNKNQQIIKNNENSSNEFLIETNGDTVSFAVNMWKPQSTKNKIHENDKNYFTNSLIIIINPGNEKTSSGYDFPGNGSGGEGYIDKVLVPFTIWDELKKNITNEKIIVNLEAFKKNLESKKKIQKINKDAEKNKQLNIEHF